MMVRRLICSLIFLAAAVPAGFSQPNEGEQLDRRDRREPTIVLNTGGRTGTCDVIKFTPDGHEILAAGDDKVVTGYPVTAAGLGDKPRQFRWPLWREQRGSIFAMDVSPDGRYVAVGGYGAQNSSVAIIDRTIKDPEQNQIAQIANLEGASANENYFAVMAIAFSPNGQQVAVGTGNGTVWIWDYKNSRPVMIGRHEQFDTTKFNRVRAIQFDDENNVRTVAEYGIVRRWTRAPGAWANHQLLDLRLPEDIQNKKARPYRAVAFSRHGWVAAAELGQRVRVVSPDGKFNYTMEMRDDNHFVRSIAFSDEGKKIALGLGRLNVGNSFRVEGDEDIRLFTIGEKDLAPVAALPHTGRVDALAWRGDRLAVAGGDNHEVRLWDTAAEKLLSTQRGFGFGLWGVSLTADGRYLAYYPKRKADSTEPNRVAAGEPRFFDLARRRYEKNKPQNARLLEPIEKYQDWTVRADPAVPYQWHVVDPQGQSHKLPWDRDQDDRPTCYTFLKPVGDGPIRLAVGHYWGFSLFEIRGNTPVRTRLYTGHHGAVTAICPADSPDWLVTASSDQTIAAWSLADWPSRTSLGAKFTALPTAVRVDSVDTASPAWEMGLKPGDEIVWLMFDGRPYFGSGLPASPAEAKARLDNPVPGKELFLFVKREGRPDYFRTLTTARTRPMWRFVPGPDGEWVLWMWQGSYYATSSHGDTLVGFVMNDATLTQSPTYYKLEQFRDVFNREEDVIAELIDNRKVAKALEVALGANPQPVSLGKNEPPAVRIELPTDTAEKAVKARLVAIARGGNIDFQPQRVELWINDFRAQKWQPLGKPFDETFAVDPALLRHGTNKLTLLVFNALGGRSEVTKTLTNPHKAESTALRGLGVGVNDYSSAPSPGGGRSWGNLKGPVKDITMQKEKWESQRGKLFNEAKFEPKTEKSASRDQVLAELDRLAKVAKPDDLLIIVLAGHGDLEATATPKPKAPQFTFYFCCPEYEIKNRARTGIDHRTLADRLANINARKLVLLDACHSGEAALGAFNPLRSLTPAGQGPTILAACDRSQEAYEHPVKHNGLFTMALLNALGDGFDKADTNHNGELDARELFSAITAAMPALLDEVKPPGPQQPKSFPRQPESFPVFKK